jgi:protein-S-isoprenylcysteine O-methyltransferase Ste14
MKSFLKKIKTNADGLSLLIFAACLFLPGFYVEETQRENPAYLLLFTGWLGVLYGYLAWLANPIFLIAFFCRNTSPRKAAFLAFIGFVIALEFLIHKRIVTDEGGGTAQITGVGWGYVLWLTSFLVFFSSVIEKLEAEKIFVNLVYVAASVLLLGFAYIYFISTGSHWVLLKERERNFSELCKKTGEQFYAKRTSPILGIYFSESGGMRYDKVYNGKIFGSIGYGMFFYGGLDEIPLIERRNDDANPKQPYVRGRHVGTHDELVSELRSNYFVEITHLGKDIPKELAVSGRELVVKEQGVDKPLAKMAYAVSREDNRFCGPLDKENSFSEVNFVYRALGLIK